MGEEQNTQNTPDVQQAADTAAAADTKDRQDEILKMLQDIKKDEDLQTKYEKKQAHRSFITALSCVLMLVAVCLVIVILLPRVNDVLSDVNVIMGDMEVVTSELAEADFEGMFGDVQDLIIEGSYSMAEAMEKLDEIDIEGLNRAIKNLSDAIQPFAAFFGRGR